MRESTLTALLVGSGVTVGLGLGYLLKGALSPVGTAASSTVASAKWPRIGFVGCGTIASAIVTGLCTLPDTMARPSSIIVSPRNRAKSAALRAAFPAIVSVAKSNQAVVDQCDVIFLCVVPQVARRVVAALAFKQEQTVISVIASLPADEVAALVGPVPPERICCAIPLPAVSVHKGATIILPNPIAKRIFSLLGTAVVARNPKELEVLLCVSCMMGPFYKSCGTIAEWLLTEGVSPETASNFVCGFHETVLSEAQHRVAHVQSLTAFEELVGEQTPGGLNEANVRDMMMAGTFDTYREALATTLQRLRGEVELTKIEVAE